VSDTLQKIRNIGICAHIDAGKTTVTERVLYFAGRTHKIGEVHDGTAVMDYLEEEQQRGITITSAATSLDWDGYTLNLIDTPGHVDFTIEVERSLRVLDGAVVVFCGNGGVEAQSETVWLQADRYNVPRICFINKLDRIGADFDRVVHEIGDRLHGNPVCLQLPMGLSEEHVGAIDLVRQKAYFYDPDEAATKLREEAIPEDYLDTAELARQDMLEAICDFDDVLMERMLAEEEPTVDEIVAAVRKGCIANKIQPVLCGSALKHIGVQPLLDAVVCYLPSPMDVPPVVGHESLTSDKEVIRKPDPTDPFSALVFKIISDSHGDMNFARVYSGTLSSGTRILNSTQGRKENISRIWQMHAKQRTACDVAKAGDIVAFVGLRNCITGDTLCDPRNPVVLERLEFPDPVISMSIEPRTNADKQDLMDALNTLKREDPSFQYIADPETGQTVISGMGELHLEIVKNKLVRDLKMEVRVGKPRVAYKEAILGQAEVEQRFIRQAGGKGQYAVVKLRVETYEPESMDEPNCFVNECPPDTIRKEFLRSIEQGVMDATTSGPLAGYPMLKVKTTLLDAEEHPADSSEIAFEAAAAIAFNEAVSKAKPVFLEPIMRVQATAPEEYLGAVTGDLGSRRAMITSQELRGKFRVVTADAPLSEMFGYETQLRSLTQGRGNSTMAPSSYAPAPQQVADQILKYV